MTAALALIALAALAALALGLVARARAGHGPRAMGGGRARLWLDPRLPAAGRRNLHHLHLSGRVRLFLRAGGSGLLHPGLRLARVCDRLFPAAPGLELRREHGLHSQPDFFVRKYASPSLGVLVSIVDLVALIPQLPVVMLVAVSFTSTGNTTIVTRSRPSSREALLADELPARNS